MKNVWTGTILPIGDGMTGKTVLVKLLTTPVLDEETHTKIIYETKKTVNIEMEFLSQTIHDADQEKCVVGQYYVFPGQRIKESERTMTFDEIMNIFGFLPALKNITVLLLVHDTSRIRTLRSLENWLKAILKMQLLHENSLILLVNNKIDLQRPNEFFINQLLTGIKNIIQQAGSKVKPENIRSVSTSCVTLEGITELRDIINTWIAKYGLSLSKGRCLSAQYI